MLNANEEIAQFRHRSRVEMRWKDVDEFGHVNNAVFSTYFEQGRIRYLQETCDWDWKSDGLILANIHINFLRPLYLTDLPFIYIRCSRLGSKSFKLDYLIVGTQGSSKEKIASGSTVMVMFDYEQHQSVAIPERIRQKLIDYEFVKIDQKI